MNKFVKWHLKVVSMFTRYLYFNHLYEANFKQLAEGRVSISQETLEIRLLRVFFNTPLLCPVEH